MLVNSVLSEHRKKVLRAWYARTREARRLKHKEWREKNRAHLLEVRKRDADKICEQKRQFRKRNSQKIAAIKRADYLSDNGARAKARAKAWKLTNPARARELEKMWRVKNRERYIAAKRRDWQKKKSDPFKRLNHNMGRLMWMALRKQGGKAGLSWRDMVGFSVDDLRRHLESKFRDGMTWDAFLRGEIHVDHIRPISWFRFTSVCDPAFKECWALSNLQPLWASENLSKQARWAG